MTNDGNHAEAITTERAGDQPVLLVVGGEIALAGVLTIDTLSVALNRLSTVTAPIDRVSFEAVGKLDSAAVVFLIECQKKAARPLALLAVPERLDRLLDLYGLDGLFSRPA